MAFVIPIPLAIAAAAGLGTAGGVAAVTTAILRIDPFRKPDIPMQISGGLLHRRKLEKRAKEIKLDYTTKINIAFIGGQKHGKSTMLNAFRGLANDEKGAVKADAFNSTDKPTPIEWENYVLWDVPGAGSSEFPAAEYFDKFCLYLFDVLVIFIESIEESDDKFIKTAVEQDINFVIVRSKGDILVEMSTNDNKKLPKAECAANLVDDFNTKLNEKLRELKIRRYVERCLICAPTVLSIQKGEYDKVEHHLREFDEFKFIRYFHSVIQQRRMERYTASKVDTTLQFSDSSPSK